MALTMAGSDCNSIGRRGAGDSAQDINPITRAALLGSKPTRTARCGPLTFRVPDTLETGLNRHLIWGGYGWGNTGDDLTLAIALRDQLQLHGKAVSVLTPNVRHTQQSLPDINLVPVPTGRPRLVGGRWLWRWAEHAASQGKERQAGRLYRLARYCQRRDPAQTAWVSALHSASTLHLAGGGYLTDLFDQAYMLRPLWMARVMKLRITTAPLGIGPFTRPNAAHAVARALQGVSLRVRDADSMRFCQTNGLSASEHADDGFRLAEVLPAIHLGGGCKATPPTLGVCVFPQYAGEWSAGIEQWWEDCLRAVSQALPDWNIEGFCFHTDRSMDYHTTQRVFLRAGLNPGNVHTPEHDYRKAIMRLRRFQGVLSTRFHAIVTATVLRVPSVAVAMNPYYGIKMQSTLKQSTAPACLVNAHQDTPQAASQFLSRHLSRSHPVRDT